jgi:hydrogenase nickel incorporation protein HypB
MCSTCGCGEGEVRIGGHEHASHGEAHHGHRHGHASDHGHGLHEHPSERSNVEPEVLDLGNGAARAHAPGMTQSRMVQVERDILEKNDAYAADNRRYLNERGVFALNLVSSPGSGKTTLLLRTIERLRGRVPIAVIEGDQQTSRDADRIRASGVESVQINTGKGCHLDAHMVGHALERMHLHQDSLLFVENVGNLVCPAAFDLGEAHKVLVISVTEGEDKPLKYPDMFRAADLMLVNKTDLLPYVDFDVEQCIAHARRIKPALEVLQVSASRGDGLEAWCGWLEAGLARARAERSRTVEALERRNAELEAEVTALRARLGERS